MTADVTQPASWTLREERGVCDELSGLFIAMSRSLGIPARFFTGVAYTNWEGKNEWGPHGWAEIYIPDAGWVPYDVTYGEYGFVDSSHIKLQDSVDAGKSSVGYSWLGRDVDLKINKFETNVSLLQGIGISKGFIDIETKMTIQ